MNSSLGFSFRRAAFAAVSLGLVAGACLDVSPKKPMSASTCTVTAECAAGSECSAGVCVPYTACMTDGQCGAGQHCTGGACRATCTTDAQCTPLGLVCSLAVGECVPAPTPSGGAGGDGANAGSVGTGGSAALGGSAGTGAGGMTQTGPVSDLVDDLEDNDARIIQAQGRQGSWYAFSDGTVNPSPPDDNGNANGFLPGAPGAATSAHAAHVASSNFPNYAGVAVDFNNSGLRPKDTANRKVYDVSGYDGITFRAKGTSSGSMRVMAVTQQIAGKAEGGTCDDSNTANHCWDSYGKDFSLASDWADVRVRFSDMTTDNSSPFDASQVFGVAFQDNAQNGSLDLWIDDLALFKDGGSGGAGGSGGSGSGSGSGGVGTSGGSGNAGSGAGGSMSMGGTGAAGATSCMLPGSANPGSGSFTWYYFGQGTAQQNGMYKTACGYTGTEAGMTDTVSNIVSSHYFAAIPGKNGFDTVSHCGECVKISNGGKSIVATVIDECPTDNGQNPACTPDHLDLSWQAWNDLSYSSGAPSGTTWQFVPCAVTGNVTLSFNGPNEVYVQNTVVPIQSVSMNGANGNHTSYGSWQFGSAVQGQTITITDTAGRVITVTANNGNSGKQFPVCD